MKAVGKIVSLVLLAAFLFLICVAVGFVMMFRGERLLSKVALQNGAVVEVFCNRYTDATSYGGRLHVSLGNETIYEYRGLTLTGRKLQLVPRYEDAEIVILVDESGRKIHDNDRREVFVLDFGEGLFFQLYGRREEVREQYRQHLEEAGLREKGDPE